MKTWILTVFSNFAFVSGRTGFDKEQLLKIVSDRSPPYKILEMMIGSFHGCGRKWFVHGIYQSNFNLSVFSDFSFLFVKSEFVL